MERADIAIIGTGPAGVSAAITAKVRSKTVLLFGSRELSSKLTKAHKIQNYPGLPDIDGAQLAQAFKKHLDVLEIPITEKQVTAVYAMGGYFGTSLFREFPSWVMFCRFSWTIWLVAWSWLPFTASVEVAEISPGATWAMVRSFISRPV